MTKAKMVAPHWNFEKFLIDSEGNLIKHGNCKDMKPNDLEDDIKELC